jgi:C1A family cysteine protease
MRNPLSKFVLASLCAATLLNGCSKSNLSSPQSTPTDDNTVVTPHVYGVLPPDPAEYSNIPLYSPETFSGKITDLSVNGAAPAVYTLVNPPVRNQGQIGSCTAFCGTETYEILYYYGHSNTFPTTLSPAYLYYCERVKIQKQSISADNGASMANIPQALQKYGLCLETLYAYPSSDKSTAYNTAPSSAAVSNALGFEIGQAKTSYARVNSGDTAAVKNLLRNNIPVMMGLNVYDNSKYQYFEGLNTKNYTYNPLTSTGALASGVQLLGGHATPIIGYDDTKQAFLVQNSWGTNWGNKGFYYMPYSVFMSTKIVPQGGVYYATLN